MHPSGRITALLLRWKQAYSQCMSRTNRIVSSTFGSTHSQASGRWLLPMLLHWNEWVHRRVTTVSFVNERQFYRHVSIDFTIPTWRASPGYNSIDSAHI